MQPGFLPLSLVARLGKQVRREVESGVLRAACIGAGANKRYAPEIRSDHIRWLDPAAPTPAEAELHSRLDRLRSEINRRAQLGLFDWEGHVASYPPGAFYQRHLDVFRHARERVASTVLYLNPNWQPGDGGELRIYLDGKSLERFVDIPPLGGTLVTFLSEEVYHAVQPAQVERSSVTGWFRTRVG
ncbi:MAG: SM-20-related protein [Bradymonadia bacterium]